MLLMKQSTTMPNIEPLAQDDAALLGGLVAPSGPGLVGGGDGGFRFHLAEFGHVDQLVAGGGVVRVEARGALDSLAVDERVSLQQAGCLQLGQRGGLHVHGGSPAGLGLSGNGSAWAKPANQGSKVQLNQPTRQAATRPASPKSHGRTQRRGDLILYRGSACNATISSCPGRHAGKFRSTPGSWPGITWASESASIRNRSNPRSMSPTW